MESRLDTALALRRNGQLDDSRAALLEMAAARPDDATILYQCAWAHDLLGLEREAAPYYERAIACGLDGDELRGALLGLGSTYRCIGEYRKAAETLRRGVATFPEDRALQVFLAMALYHVDEVKEAMGLLLENLAATTADPSIGAYRSAIAFSADKLDQTW
jgi:predicted Zn-dependent protease